MKKNIFILALVFMCSCSTEFDQFSGQDEEMRSETFCTHEIDNAKALEIANLYFNQSQTRSSTSLKMDYIVNHSMTRNGTTGIDTLAYVFNRGTKNGFVIVSSDDRVYPIIAHSKTGTFKYEKGDIIDAQFISRLGAYLENNKNSHSKNITPDDLATCYTSFPVLTTSWRQGSPYDKYVIKEHPGCPVGCVAVAAGMIMAHCKSSLVYHGITFEFERIVEGLRTDYYSGGFQTRIVNGGVGGNTTKPKVEPYSRDIAEDYAAKLLYWIGKDIKMDYKPGGSGASPILAHELMSKLGYHPIPDLIFKYKIEEVLEYLLSNNLLLMVGADMDDKGSHAWVVDGYAYCIDPITKIPIQPYVHCDWGWGGYGNGYYSGEVFAVDSYNFGRLYYFAVSIEK